MSTLIGNITLSSRRVRELGVKQKSPLSPALEKCALRACAKTSYQQASEDLEAFLGVKVGHSTLHRLVERVSLPEVEAKEASEEMSVDGGKVCLRNEEGKSSQWRDYKLVSLHGSICQGYFQEPEALKAWYEKQPPSPIVTSVGDGHDGVWNVIEDLTSSVPIRRQVLDWYHLKENLYKVGGSYKRLQNVESWLWRGRVDDAIDAFEELKRPQAKRFQKYLRKHRHRIPDYRLYQERGIAIGSGNVESKIKQVGMRLKVAGARWSRKNVGKMLHLRCSYLNRSPSLSIYSYA